MKKPFGFVTAKGKFVNNDLLSGYATKGEESRQLPADSFQETYGNHGIIQPLFNPEALARLLEINTYHYRACKTKARDVAGLGYQLRPLHDDANKAQFIAVDEMLSGLDEPLGMMLDKVGVDYEALGYAALEMTREDYDFNKAPSQLAHIPAHTLRAHKDGVRFLQMRGKKKVWFKKAGYPYDVDMETGETKELGQVEEDRRATEILWLVNYTPQSDYYGVPDILPALGAIHGDISRRDYNIAFFDNYGVPAYAVFITGDFDPGEIDEEGKSAFEKDIEGHFASLAKSPHSTLVLSVPTTNVEGKVNIEFKPLSVDVKEASFRLYRQDNRDEVLAAHGVPPYRMGIAETGSLGGSTAKESTEIYKRSVIEPRQEIIEALFNRYILWGGFEAYDWKFELAEIDTQDEAHDMDMVSALFDLGAITPNQIITYFGERFGLDPIDHPAMDAHYINGMAIDLDVDVSPEIEAALLGLQERLLEVVKKDAKGTEGSTEYIDVLASIKAITPKATGSRTSPTKKASKSVRRNRRYFN